MINHSVGQFSGPLDYILQLIQREDLDLHELSLIKIADDFAEYVSNEKIETDEFAEWLLIASKLLLIKAKYVSGGIKDEDTAILEEELMSQLKLLKRFKDAEIIFNKLWNSDLIAIARKKPLEIKIEVSEVLNEKSKDDLLKLFVSAIRRKKSYANIPIRTIERLITIQEKISDILQRRGGSGKFVDFLEQANDRQEAVALFLAMLEMLRLRQVRVDQHLDSKEIIITVL